MGRKIKITQDPNRLLDENGIFKSTFNVPDGQICIGMIEELCEYLYNFRDDLSLNEKLELTLQLEENIDQKLNGKNPLLGIKCNYIPTWSKILINDIKQFNNE